MTMATGGHTTKHLTATLELFTNQIESLYSVLEWRHQDALIQGNKKPF